MVGERLLEDAPNNALRLVDDIRPRSTKPTLQSGIDAVNRFSSANRRAVNKYLGKVM